MKKAWLIIGRIVAVIGIIGAISGAALYLDKFFTSASDGQENIMKEVKKVQISTDSLSKGMNQYKAETDAHREAKKENAEKTARTLNQMRVNQEVLIENQHNPEEIVNEIKRRMTIRGLSTVEPIDTAEVR